MCVLTGIIETKEIDRFLLFLRQGIRLSLPRIE